MQSLLRTVVVVLVLALLTANKCALATPRYLLRKVRQTRLVSNNRGLEGGKLIPRLSEVCLTEYLKSCREGKYHLDPHQPVKIQICPLRTMEYL